jgi:hypothetical protein
MGLAMLAAVPPAAPWPQTLAAQVPQDKAKAFDDEFERGRQLLQRHEYFEALEVLDGEGIVRMETKGSGFHDVRALRDAVDQQIA